jgi:hypothetical protein
VLERARVTNSRECGSRCHPLSVCRPLSRCVTPLFRSLELFTRTPLEFVTRILSRLSPVLSSLSLSYSLEFVTVLSRVCHGYSLEFVTPSNDGVYLVTNSVSRWTPSFDGVTKLKRVRVKSQESVSDKLKRVRVTNSRE